MKSTSVRNRVRINQSPIFSDRICVVSEVRCRIQRGVVAENASRRAAARPKDRLRTLKAHQIAHKDSRNDVSGSDLTSETRQRFAHDKDALATKRESADLCAHASGTWTHGNFDTTTLKSSVFSAGYESCGAPEASDGPTRRGGVTPPIDGTSRFPPPTPRKGRPNGEKMIPLCARREADHEKSIGRV